MHTQTVNASMHQQIIIEIISEQQCVLPGSLMQLQAHVPHLEQLRRLRQGIERPWLAPALPHSAMRMFAQQHSPHTCILTGLAMPG